MIEVLPVRRALIAVADKAGVVEFAERLAKLGAEIVSTGRTAQAIAEAGVPVTPVAEVTGFPEMLGGRVKTLHPKIHGGILADKRLPEHMAQLADHGIEPFDLVAVNLYPFRETVARGVTTDEAVEQIDIGGPAMVRAAAKNFESVAVVVDPGRYEDVVDEVERHRGLSRALRLSLAGEAFAHTAAYDAAIADFFAGLERESTPEWSSLQLSFRLVGGLRYGENPHQRAALYRSERGLGPLGGAEVLQGKEMSYNNWLDTDAARGVAGVFGPGEPVAVIVKHHNPCGVAVGATLAQAYTRAFEGDTVSAFGGIVAFNGDVDEEAARAMAGVFTEVVVAPSFTDGALAAYAEKTNLRVVRAPLPDLGGEDVRPIDGGALVQDADTVTEGRSDMRVVTSREPTADQWEDLLFAWKVAARAKSNAIVLASGRATVGVGAGQMNRVTSVEIAARHAGEKARGSVMASDAFFPFRDGIDRAAEAGVVAVIQPGGSIRDEEIIAAAEEHGLAMVVTGRRHFRH
jgi:phosphoribosylaminoimidazolecarboxamide formyltransferase/IMP cyclohydrolase